MRFVERLLTFAAAVRRANDHGDAIAERATQAPSG
jgi:hypothetical protein